MGIQLVVDTEIAKLYESLTSNNDADIENYMRPFDIRIFSRYSLDRGVFVLVRRTNIYSVPYIGRSGFVPKPLECKPKTAKSNASFVNKEGKQIKSNCAGLVVNPYLLGKYAFQSPGNNGLYGMVMAKRVWSKYWGTVIPSGFSVQMDESSGYYGCVMRNGRDYIHGDYDLYALIHKDTMSERHSQPGEFEGVAHKHSKEWEDFEYFANYHMGVKMIQHGSQEHFCEHSDEDVDIFAPFGERHLQVRKIVGGDGLRRIYHKLFDRHTQGERLYLAGIHGTEIIQY